MQLYERRGSQGTPPYIKAQGMRVYLVVSHLPVAGGGGAALLAQVREVGRMVVELDTVTTPRTADNFRSVGQPTPLRRLVCEQVRPSPVLSSAHQEALRGRASWRSGWLARPCGPLPPEHHLPQSDTGFHVPGRCVKSLPGLRSTSDQYCSPRARRAAACGGDSWLNFAV